MNKNGDRGPTPPGLANYQRNQAACSLTWDDLAVSEDYGPVLRRLHGTFHGLCAYCETIVKRKKGAPGPVDHFRPQKPQNGDQIANFGNDFTFKWTNLMYACHRCQSVKANKWPGTLAGGGDETANSHLRQAAQEKGYKYIDPEVGEGYINPDSKSPDASIVSFDFDERAKMDSFETISDKDRSRAERTIYDLKLNAKSVRYDRRAHFVQVFLQIRGHGRSQREGIIRDYSSPKDSKGKKWKPPLEFPSFIEAVARKGWLDGRLKMPEFFREVYDKIESA